MLGLNVEKCEWGRGRHAWKKDLTPMAASIVLVMLE
jgi:hypothetical protein